MKKLLSAMLALVLVATFFPVFSQAEGQSEPSYDVAFNGEVFSGEKVDVGATITLKDTQAMADLQQLWVRIVYTTKAPDGTASSIAVIQQISREYDDLGAPLPLMVDLYAEGSSNSHLCFVLVLIYDNKDTAKSNNLSAKRYGLAMASR